MITNIWLNHSKTNFHCTGYINTLACLLAFAPGNFCIPPFRAISV